MAKSVNREISVSKGCVPVVAPKAGFEWVRNASPSYPSPGREGNRPQPRLCGGAGPYAGRPAGGSRANGDIAFGAAGMEPKQKKLPNRHKNSTELTVLFIMRIRKTTLQIISLAIMAMMLSVKANAQKKDPLAAIKEFMEICNSYKQMPLYLDVEVLQTASSVTGGTDTMRSHAEFFLKKGDSYIRFGAFEQLVNDSVALLVSDSLQRMIVYPDAAPVLSRMKAMTGMQTSQASLTGLAKKYRAEKKRAPGGAGNIVLSSRDLVHGTSLPEESVELEYDPKAKTPQKISTVKRSLLLVDEAVYETLRSRPELEGKLLKTENNEHYLVRERSAVFVYKKITHEGQMKLPATIADRISRNKNGGFEPVKGYENYQLTVN